nr:Gag-Pol polyprotein [Tanacetum cinerariifolium]
MKAILRKDKCLAVIGERPVEVTDKSKWDEMHENDIANLHMALAYLVLSSIEEKKSAKEIWDHLARLYEARSLQIKMVINEGMKRFADVWLFDTRATFHMTVRREWFHQYKPVFEGGSVYSCNDHELKIIRIGSIMVKMYDGEITEEAEAFVASRSSSHKTMVTWHRKLGHMSEKGMKILVERKLHLGLTKVSNLSQAPVQSQGGAKYFVSFIYDYSIRCWVYPIKKKSDVFKVFKVYKAWVELDSGKKIKCLRKDNGGEYTSDEFNTFFGKEGIKRLFTTAYTPQQNRVAELMNKTLLERARSMLATTSLGKSFRAEAINTACYVINHSPSTAVELLIESISIDLEYFDDGFATKAKERFNDSLKESKFPVLSRMARDILSVQATSVASESAFSTSGNVLSIRRTRLTPTSLEMCMCLKDHLDVTDRIQHTSNLENSLDFEEDILEEEVLENEVIALSDEEIALDEAASEARSNGSGGEEIDMTLSD